MTRATAIEKFCKGCAGGSFKEVTLCHLVGCPLWEYRFGNSTKSKYFEKRMKQAKEKYPEEWKEMLNTLSIYLETLGSTNSKTIKLGVFVRNI